MKYFFIFIFIFYCKTAEKIDNSFLKVSKVTSFTGKNLTDGVLTAQGRKDKNVIHVTNEYEKFYITLPYSEDWIFTESQNSILSIHSEKINLTSSVSKEDSIGFINTEIFLNELKNRIQSRIGLSLLNVQILDSENNKILFYSISKPENGYKQYHYWSVRQNKNFIIYKYHLSFESGDYINIESINQNIKILMDDGFKLF